MNSACANCCKTVYPVEKLNVLDKVWHKGCFKCSVCNITLTLKTYKGYDKNPYCNVHYPTTKFTAVADTPENQRLKKINDSLSLNNYHKEYNTSIKGTKKSVAEDPELLRTKKNQDQLSANKYHGKDRTNPATTPLSRPAFSAPAPEPPAPEPVREPSPEPDNVKDPTPEPSREPTPEPPAAEPEEEEAVPPPPSPAKNVDSDEEQAAPPAPVPEPEAEPPIPQETPSPEPDAEQPAAPGPDEEDAVSKYVALYDYDAGDDDEVTIKEGDIVVNGEIIAEGWMVGTNVRTGLHGMLPSNYVELCGP